MADRVGGGGAGRGANRPPPNRRGRPAPRPTPREGSAPPRRAGGVHLRHLGHGVFELIHPGCVQEMWPDYEEGIEIWKSGEAEEARDALRFALQGCGDNMWVHAALGRIALETFRDPTLARGHFGYAYELAKKAIPTDFTGKIPPDRAPNRPLFDAIDGLIACHEALGESEDAARLRVLARTLAG